MKIQFVCIIMILSLTSMGYAQFSSDVDGNLNISPVNGNMIYTYPISNNTIDGFPIKVDLNYSSNVIHTTLSGYNFDFQSNLNGWTKLSYTLPEWIVGVNGFAVDVLTKKNDFIRTKIPMYLQIGGVIDDHGFIPKDTIVNTDSAEVPDDINNSNLSTCSLNAIPLIEGYDYTNRMQRLNEADDQDLIRILRSDGSVLELKNPTRFKDVNSENDPSLYTGYYYENGINTEGFAVVQYDTLNYFPNYIKSLVDSLSIINSVSLRNSFLPRVLKYYKGDGLEYVFREIIAPYGLRAYLKLKARQLTLSAPGNASLTIFYLEEINSDMKNLVTFKRDWHYFASDTEMTRGRAFITDFANHKFSFGESELKIQVFDRTINCSLEEENQYLSGDKTNFKRSSFHNISTEINTPYSYLDYSRPYMKYNVTNISDPEGRKTKFSFIYHIRTYTNFFVPFTEFWTMQCRIDKIFEPTKKYEITYYENNKDNNYIITPSEVNSSKLCTKAFSTINEAKKYELIINNEPKLLQKITYSWNESSSEYPRICTTKIFDNNNNDTNIVLTYFKKFESIPFRYTSNQSLSYKTPKVSALIPIKTESIYNTKIITQESIYDSAVNLGGHSRFNLYPKSNLQKVKNLIDNIEILQSKSIFQYQFIITNPFGNNNDLANQYGESVIISKEKFINPNNNDTIRKVERHFLHLGLEDVPYSRVDSVWDKSISIRNTDSLRFLNDLDKTDKTYHLKTFLDWKLPPIANSPLKEIIRNSNDSIIGGKLYSYNSVFDGSNPTLRRGALKSEYIIGRNGQDTILVATYNYNTGKRLNLLTSTENTLGVKKRSFFDYSSINGLGNNYPVGMKLFNNNEIENVSIYHEFPEFESPIATEDYVRKISPSGNVYLDTLRTYFEKTYYGQNSSMIDQNGWFYANEYDKNGRIKYNWQPFDFPKCNETTNGIVEERIPVFDDHTIVTQTTDIVNYQSQTITHPSNKNQMVYTDKLLVGKEISASTPFGIPQIQGTIVQYNSDYSSTFSYIARDNDPIHTSSSIEELQLKLAYAGDYKDKCMILNVKTDKFNLDKKYLIGCQALSYQKDTLSYYDKPYQSPMLIIDLMPILDSLKNMSNGSKVTFEVSSPSTDGKVELMNMSVDQKPGIMVKYLGCDIHQDFTSAFNYDDTLRTISSLSKIDDYLHTTTKNWTKTYSNKDGRYSGNVNYFGAENRNLKNELLIGSPASPTRIDSVHFDLNGFNQVTNSYDQFNNETITHYDDEGNIYRIIAPDANLSSKYFSYYIIPDTLTGQYLYGFGKFIVGTDENNKKNIEYYDAFGRLRRKILDSDSLKITTKYEYDNFGNLTQVMHPNNEFTNYFYDNFNRVKFKFNQDLDTLSFNYDLLGRLRFSQNKVQKKNNALSYIEYDDLNRIVISGEAQIDTVYSDFRNSPVWLTDTISPNKLNFIGWNYDTNTLNLNPKLWSDIFVSLPEFWSLTSMDTTKAFPIIMDTLDNRFPGPYIMHPVNYYKLKQTTYATRSNFENISQFPQFVKTANHYDELPPSVGPIWNKFPEKFKWDSIVPFYAWDRNPKTPRNLKGRKSAIAYRDNGNEPFHYAVMSYDPRGRVQAILRYTENLGFDAVYYTYNSANQVLNIRVADPLRQYITWYGYDNNGRVDSVWTMLTKNGTGLGVKNDLRYPSCPIRPNTADIVYSYDKRGNIDTLKFLPSHLTQVNVYNVRGWLDSSVAKDNFNNLFFRQAFERDYGGNIKKQISQHRNKPEVVQKYDYDRLYRLTNWSNGSDSVRYSYDIMSNRYREIKNLTDTIAYNNSNPLFSNRLIQSRQGNNVKNYEYNSLGAVSRLITLNNIDSLFVEDFEYTGEGRIKQYSKRQMGLFPYPCPTFPFTKNVQPKWEWRYRYSAFGGREQKRLYYSPLGDSSCGPMNNYHQWTYYLQGAGGEQLAVYKGVQVAAADTSGHTGRRVYLYPHSFISAGGGLITLADSTKQFNIMDNLGSCRATVSYKNNNTSVIGFDYKPFGDTLNADDETLIGFAGQERDEESRYFDMGARQYDPRSGRFLSIDPLFEKFPTQTPYQYAFNNPLSFKDPSGLEPESEKREGDKGLYAEIQSDLESSSALSSALLQETGNARALMDKANEELLEWVTRAIQKMFGGGGSRAGSTSGNNREGTDDAKNGMARDAIKKIEGEWQEESSKRESANEKNNKIAQPGSEGYSSVTNQQLQQTNYSLVNSGTFTASCHTLCWDFDDYLVPSIISTTLKGNWEIKLDFIIISLSIYPKSDFFQDNVEYLAEATLQGNNQEIERSEFINSQQNLDLNQSDWEYLGTVNFKNNFLNTVSYSFKVENFISFNGIVPGIIWNLNNVINISKPYK